jgi:hypothetical protein
MNNEYKLDRAVAQVKAIGDYRQRLKLYAIFNSVQLVYKAGIWVIEKLLCAVKTVQIGMLKDSKRRIEL